MIVCCNELIGLLISILAWEINSNLHKSTIIGKKLKKNTHHKHNLKLTEVATALVFNKAILFLQPKEQKKERNNFTYFTLNIINDSK